jgi:hypothetical protein
MSDGQERDATVRAGAAQGFSVGDGGSRVPAPGVTRAATGTSRRCSSALPTLGSSGRTRGWCCAIWAAPRATRQHLTPAWWVGQYLATGRLTKRYRPAGTGVCPKVHGRRCGLLAETDALHDALGSRYPALDAARWASGTPRYARLAFIIACSRSHPEGSY